MKTSPRFAALALLLNIAVPAFAHEFKLGDLTVGHPYAIETAAAAKTGAGYMTITNNGAAADRLVEVRTAFPKTTIHLTEVDADGVARMGELDSIEIAPGASVTLAPRGTHVMFMGLTEPLKDGDRVDATLVFEKAGAVAVQFNVEPRGAGGAEDHGMDHSAAPGADAPVTAGSTRGITP